MGWFARKKPQQDTSERDLPDGHLAPLTRAEADRLRAEMRQVLAECGVEGEVFGDHLRTLDGGSYGLDNLMRKVLDQDPSGWPEIVRTHVSALLTAVTPIQDDDERSARITSRLFDVTDADPRVDLGYAPQWQDGVAEVLTLDYSDRVQFLNGAEVETLRPLGAWFDRARANLRRQLADAEVSVERLDGAEGQWVLGVVADSVYIASGATILDEVLRTWHPSIDLAAGVLFAIPCRNQILFRACDSSDAAFTALQMLPRLALDGYARHVGPVSPHVYYWRDGRITQITHIEGSALEVRIGPELADILGDRLGG